jgi:hypothetical protein
MADDFPAAVKEYEREMFERTSAAARKSAHSTWLNQPRDPTHTWAPGTALRAGSPKMPVRPAGRREVGSAARRQSSRRGMIGTLARVTSGELSGRVIVSR